MIKKLIKITDQLLDRPNGASESLITFVKDRLGHDLRYAIDSSKINKELGWKSKTSLEKGLVKTVKSFLFSLNSYSKK